MKEDDFLEEARERYRISCEGWEEIYSQAREDLQFTYDLGSGQWPVEVREKRKGRPMITVNKLQKFVRQIRGDFMANRPSMKVIPVDDKADISTAELYNGIIRQVEYLSNADKVYDTAYAGAIASSIGYFRIITKYEDDESFNQGIYLKRIINPMSVHPDPFAVEFNLEDAEYFFIEELLDKKDYQKLYPKASTLGFSGEKDNLYGSWMQQDKVRVCEYYYKEYTKEKLVQLSDSSMVTLTKEITPDYIKSLGLKIVRDREIDSHKIKWKKINGAEILEETDWAGKDIPIIPMFGDEVVIEGKKNYLSLIRGAKGSQQMYNYWASAATENLMLTPKTPFLIDFRQIEGFTDEWDDSNITPRPYNRYKHIQGIPKPSREPQTQVPQAIIGMMDKTAYDIEDHLGRYEASKGEAGNERSGKAIVARIAQSDKGTFTFVDNASQAIIAGLRQIIDLIPKIYDTPRALNILGENGDRAVVGVNQPAIGARGEDLTQNDLKVGKYDVIASIGASFGSKREESVSAMEKAMQYAPALANVIAPLYFKYSDFPGAQEIATTLGQAAKQMEQQAQGQPAQ